MSRVEHGAAKEQIPGPPPAERAWPAEPQPATGVRVRWLSEWAACLALLNIGIYTALLGPALPDIAERAGVRLGAAGALFTALFAAATVSTLVAGRAVDRAGTRPPLVVGLVLNGLALALFPLMDSWPATLATAALLGFGDGAVVVSVHVLVGQLNPEREAAALNRLNVFFGVGAVLGPALGALVHASGARTVLLLQAVAALQFVCAVLIVSRRVPGRMNAHNAGDANSAPPARLLTSGRLWLLAALLLVYVGIELGLGAWAFTYAREAAGLDGTAAALLTSAFWCSLTVGRLLSPLVLRRRTPGFVLAGGSLLATAGALLLLLGGERPALLTAGVLIAGAGFGPVWPVVFAFAARWFPASSGSASGVLAMVSAVGAIAVPWFQGRMLDRSGPGAVIAVTFAGCLVLSTLALVVRRVPETPPAVRDASGIGATER